jgi:tRNA A-37 threonylcarbamoyl transferase component Bud32
VEKQYELYCLANPIFYDSPLRSGRHAHFQVINRPLPAGWQRTPHGDWMMYRPPDSAMAPHSAMPRQGWKIHVSACPENAAGTLARVWEYCVPREVPFKVISSELGVRMRNMKYAPRPASGKAATIYPASDAACERVLRELGADLAGAPGPYILSDLRYGDGPLYVRYGGFAERFCLDSRGELVRAIENPAGELVPDVRSPVFNVPEWVTLPEFLAPQLAARDSVGLADLSYEVTGALHFSNGGGVYTGIDKRDGRKVILKEARPHAGLAADGSDAVARLRREHDLMLRLSGLGIAPEVLDYFQVGDHHFLAEEFIEGSTLNSFFAHRYPLIAADPGREALAAYTEWAMRVCAGAERAAALMHARGVVFNDLHLFNIMVRPDDTVALIDFEAASDLREGRRMTVGNPGFAAPRDRTGLAVDAYSLACLRLALFMPLTTLFPLDLSGDGSRDRGLRGCPGPATGWDLGQAKAAQLAAEAAAIFPVPEGYFDEAVAEIAGSPAALASPPAGVDDTADDDAGTGARWRRLSGALVSAIRASATPARTDRLFPGDVDQFRVPGGGISLAYGAAGVLFALSEAAGVRVPEYEEWLVARAGEPPAGVPLGLYDGLAGVAWALARLGHRDAAVKIAGMCLEEKWERLGHNLFDGLAGLALALFDVADSAAEPALADAAERAAEIVAEGTGFGAAAGLMRGAAGRALLLIRVHERTGDPGYLDAAAAAIAADLRQCVPDGEGGLQVNEGWRTLPYLKAGSAGIGMVIDTFLRHREDADLAAAAEKIATAASAGYYAQSGLFNGRAGLLCFLAGREGLTARVQAHVTRLGWHAVAYQGGVAFPGDMLFRLSMDLGTGTAGVLLGLATALGPGVTTALPGFTAPGFTALPGAAVRPGATVRQGLAQPVSFPTREDRQMARR